MIKILGVTIV